MLSVVVLSGMVCVGATSGAVGFAEGGHAAYPADPARERSDRPTTPTTPTTPTPTDACGAFAITQSTNSTQVGNQSVWCGNAQYNDETSMARGFVAPFTLDLQCVSFGVRQNTGDAWPVNVRVLLGDITSPYPSLTLLTQETVSIPAGAANQLFTVMMPDVTIPSGAHFVVELNTPTRNPVAGGDNALLNFGFNTQGQSAPSYVRADECGNFDFTDIASLGFPTRHLVMSLSVDMGAATPSAGGFALSPIGGAAMALLGEEIVAGGAAGAPAGIAIDYGSTSMGAGATFRVLSEGGEIGATVSIGFQGAATEDRLIFRDNPSNPDEALLELDFDLPGFETFDVHVYNQGEFVGTIPGQTSGSVLFKDPGTGVQVWKWLKNLLGIKAEAHCNTKKEYYENGQIKSCEKSYGGSIGTSLIAPGGGGVGYIGDEFRIAASVALPSSGEPPITVNIVTTGIQGVALDVGTGAPTAYIGDAETMLRPETFGSSTELGTRMRALDWTGKTVTMSVLDFTGDGLPDLIVPTQPPAGTAPVPSTVRMELADKGLASGLAHGVVSASIGMEVVSPASAGACLMVCTNLEGPGGIIIPGGKTQFDPWPPFPALIALSPDFTGVGTGTYTLKLLSEGNMLFVAMGQTGTAGGSGVWPERIGKLGGATPCYRIKWPKDTLFQTAGGQVVLIDEAQVLAEGTGPAEPIVSMDFSALNMQELRLFTPEVELPAFSCYADCDASGTLDFFDFLCYQNLFTAGSAAADCDASGSLDFFDFLCFQNEFTAGCP